MFYASLMVSTKQKLTVDTKKTKSWKSKHITTKKKYIYIYISQRKTTREEEKNNGTIIANI